MNRLPFPVLLMLAQEEYEDPTSPIEPPIIMMLSPEEAIALSQKIKAEKCQQLSP